jgi:hypothetical protein
LTQAENGAPTGRPRPAAQKRQAGYAPEYTHKWGLHIRPQSRIFGAKTKSDNAFIRT